MARLIIVNSKLAFLNDSLVELERVVLVSSQRELREDRDDTVLEQLNLNIDA
jgi:hypothetical protein